MSDELRALEGPRQTYELAENTHATMRLLPEHHPALKALKEDLVNASKMALEKAAVDHVAHRKAHGDTLHRKIDEAAQKVLDARGEKHTEKNILPSGVASETKA